MPVGSRSGPSAGVPGPPGPVSVAFADVVGPAGSATGDDWPDLPGRREAEAAWRGLDLRPSPSQPPVSGPPARDATEPGPSGPEPPLPPPAGRWALGAFDPGRRGIRVLVAVAVLVVLVAAYLAWRARPHAEPVTPVGSTVPAQVPASALPSGVIVVAVQGRVTHPGLYHLPAGARVADALDAAGGALPGVDLSYVNLARKLTDGELLLIGATAPPDQAGTQPASGGKVDLNTATVAQLDTLPGVGPALAQRIVEYRTQHGGFRSIDELRKVQGIGDAKFAQLKDLVAV
ncbi:MAG: ComEA family DNA-binding protein [Actinobacteria bacterium]|nr:MAG: ComEA family DNA-binding protein [Actinomycetota bacterium]